MPGCLLAAASLVSSSEKDFTQSGWKAHNESCAVVTNLGTVESGCLKVQPKAAGKLLLRLNITGRPIANKYREGKLKRTLKREFNRT